jgi:hypothetical protein
VVVGIISKIAVEYFKGNCGRLTNRKGYMAVNSSEIDLTQPKVSATGRRHVERKGSDV